MNTNSAMTIILLAFVGLLTLGTILSVADPQFSVFGIMMKNGNNALEMLKRGDWYALLQQWGEGMISLIFFALIGAPFAKIFKSDKTSDRTSKR